MNLENWIAGNVMMATTVTWKAELNVNPAQKVTGVIKMTKEKDQSLAQKEHSNIKVENRFVGIVMKDIIATKKGHYTAQLVQKETGVIKMTKEKHQSHAQKEHSNIKKQNPSVGIVMLDITVTKKDRYTAQLAQKVTGVIKMTKEKRQFLVQKEHSNIKVGNHFVGIVMKGITVLR